MTGNDGLHETCGVNDKRDDNYGREMEGSGMSGKEMVTDIGERGQSGRPVFIGVYSIARRPFSMP